jgi:cytochrome c oxidase subunit II
MGGGIPSGGQSVFAPSSPFAAPIAELFTQTLWVCAVIGFGVAAAIVYSLVAFRARPDGDEPPQGTGNRRLETLWTVVPAGIVAGLFVMTLNTMARSDPSGDPEPAITIVGHQWWWEARYPSGVVTANEIHIPVGRPLYLRLESADVIHDFWVPQLARKMDAVPGHPNFFWLSADAPGAYGGACAEYCGTQHAWMRLLVLAEPAAEFDSWQRAQLAPAQPPSDGPPSRGEQVFRNEACGNCHAVAGRGFDGRVAPDLTHLASRETLGAGVANQTPQELRAWLHDPQTVKPGCRMPDFKLTDSEVSDLLAFLEERK